MASPSKMLSVSFACLSVAFSLPLPGQSVRKAVETACEEEIQQQKGGPLWATRMVKRENGHVFEYRRLETVDGTVQLLVNMDGHPASGPEKVKNDRILHALRTDPAARKKQEDTSRADAVRMSRTLRLVPQMFRFEDKSNNSTVRVIAFTPNPDFVPSTYEERALHSLAGEMQLDAKTFRIEALDATVSDTVNFGYGLLGSLTKGGTVHLKLIEVDKDIWKTQNAKLNITGHIALVKSLSKNEDDERFDFKRLPDGCTILCALDILNVPR